MTGTRELILENAGTETIEMSFVAETEKISAEMVDAAIEKILEAADENVDLEIKTDSEKLPTMKRKRGGDYPVKQWS